MTSSADWCELLGFVNCDSYRMNQIRPLLHPRSRGLLGEVTTLTTLPELTNGHLLYSDEVLFSAPIRRLMCAICIFKFPSMERYEKKQ